ncbi:TPA: glycosyltransferase family 1 protein [Escherichia coli]|nr:glycosyltransferase family 1 protein [Escherichia coli]
MSNILFFTLPFWGHINPNRELFKYLNTKHNLLCASSGKFEKFFEELGIQMIEYPDSVMQYFGNGIIDENGGIDKKYYMGQYDYVCLSKCNMLSFSVTEDVYNSLIDLINKFNPDMILCDSFAFWAPAIAVKCRKKYICIESATNMSDISQDKYFMNYVDEVISKEIGVKLDSLEVINHFKLIEKRQKKFFAKFAGCNPIDYYIPETTIAYMSHDFQVGSDQIIQSTCFSGFYLDVENLEKKDKIFVTRGTITDSYNLDVLKRTIDYLEIRDNCKVTVTLGNVVDNIESMTQKKNFSIKKTVNQISELKSSKLMLSHGGITGVRESIMCETPVIVFPTTFHCYQVGLAIEKSCAGIMLKNHPLDKSELNDAVRKILYSDKYYNGVIELKNRMKSEHLNQNAYSYLEQYLNKKYKTVQ